MIKKYNIILQDKGSGYRVYIFKESTRRYAIDCKGRGYKEVIYLRVADISCTRGVRESMGLSYRRPCGGVPWHVSYSVLLGFYYKLSFFIVYSWCLISYRVYLCSFFILKTCSQILSLTVPPSISINTLFFYRKLRKSYIIIIYYLISNLDPYGPIRTTPYIYIERKLYLRKPYNLSPCLLGLACKILINYL